MVYFGNFFSAKGRTAQKIIKGKSQSTEHQKNTNFFPHDGQVRPRVQRRDEIVQSARHGFESAFQEHARDGDEHQREKFERCARYALRFFFFLPSRAKNPGWRKKWARVRARERMREGGNGAERVELDARILDALVSPGFWSALCGLEGRFCAHDLFSISLRSSHDLGLARGVCGGMRTKTFSRSFRCNTGCLSEHIKHY